MSLKKSLKILTAIGVAGLFIFLQNSGCLSVAEVAKPNATETITETITESITENLEPFDEETRIRALYLSSMGGVQDALFYEAPPSLNAPYVAGKVSVELSQSALKAVNLIRKMTRIPGDVVLSEEWSTYAQHASLLNYVNGSLSHYPQKPPEMADQVYAKGAAGAETSNIYYGYNNVNASELQSTILGYMDDSDAYNIKHLGHRRWLLSPNLNKIGVGYITDGSETYSAIKVFDSTYDRKVHDYDYFSWPSKGLFPVELFGAHIAWSVHPNPHIYDNTKVGDIEVYLKNMTTGHLEVFSQDEIRLVSEVSQKYFNIDTNGYGEPFAVIFRPDTMQAEEGHNYQVFITGLYTKDGKRAQISYVTEFFNVFE